MTLPYWEMTLRLVIAVILGGLIGFEREQHNRPAGFRTHILVCLGSALIMMVSSYAFTGWEGLIGEGVDPSRIAASIVTGVGFLGAGTIMRQGSSIRGLTTAASLWVVAGIGMAIGIGFYWGAFLVTFLVLLSLLTLAGLERMLSKKRRYRVLWFMAKDQPGLLGDITAVLGGLGVNIVKVDLRNAHYSDEYHSEVVNMELTVKIPSQLNIDQLLKRLVKLKGVLEMSWEGEDVEGE